MTSPFDILLKDNGKCAQDASMAFVSCSGPYRLGKAERPDIKHDNGFLDKFPPREPTAADRIQLAKWVTVLEGSEAVCNAQTGSMVAPCGGDLVDANAAYRHFLFGKGADRTIDYERFIEGDPTGKHLLEKLIADFKKNSSAIGKDRMTFSVTSQPYFIGGQDGFVGYPETANWQKAIGAHVVWVSGDVTAQINKQGEIEFSSKMVVHMEDKYNFNPGSADVQTGIADAENGQLELSGLAHQYMNYGEISRIIVWLANSQATQTVRGAPSGRTRKPSDNRRLRNRL
jgi:hypothetical protein